MLAKLEQQKAGIKPIVRKNKSVKDYSVVSPNTQQNIPSRVGKYDIMYKMGSGAYGVVYQAMDTKTNECVAAKFVSRSVFKTVENASHFEAELRIFERLDHPNIARWKDTVYLEDYIVVFMELLHGGTLGYAISMQNVFNEGTLLRIAYEILEALQYLHSRGISHRDIKPENIVFDNNMHAKLIDYGLCFDSKTNPSACGTPIFCPPEVLMCDNIDSTKADLWSFGITMHLLATGMFPFDVANYQYIIRRNFGNINEINNLIDITATGHVHTLLKSVLNANPEKRVSAVDLLAYECFKLKDTVVDFPPINMLGLGLGLFGNRGKSNLISKKIGFEIKKPVPSTKSFIHLFTHRPKATNL